MKYRLEFQHGASGGGGTAALSAEPAAFFHPKAQTVKTVQSSNE